MTTTTTMKKAVPWGRAARQQLSLSNHFYSPFDTCTTTKTTTTKTTTRKTMPTKTKAVPWGRAARQQLSRAVTPTLHLILDTWYDNEDNGNNNDNDNNYSDEEGSALRSSVWSCFCIAQCAHCTVRSTYVQKCPVYTLQEDCRIPMCLDRDRGIKRQNPAYATL